MMESRISGSRPGRLMAEPANFLHGIDLQADHAVFFETNRRLLSEAAFVDGRSDIAVGPPEFARLSELMRTAPREPAPERFIFHLSFCGSTLLSRLIDAPGQSLVLKEPNCLVDLATWKSLKRRSGGTTERLGPALQLARYALRRPFELGEAVTVKPSSWANNLIDELAADGAGILPLFVTIDRPGFLRAVFRGGTARLTFTAQLAWHMASGMTGADELLAAAAATGSDPLAKAANLALLAHHLQLAAFGRALRRGGWGADHIIDVRAITESPLDAATKACRALRLALETEDLERNVERVAGRHSKQPLIGYSPAHRRTDDQAVLAHHGEAIASALSWAGEALGAEVDLESLVRQPA